MKQDNRVYVPVSVRPLLCQRSCNALIAGGEIGPRCPACDDAERWINFWTRVLAPALTPGALARTRVELGR